MVAKGVRGQDFLLVAVLTNVHLLPLRSLAAWFYNQNASSLRSAVQFQQQNFAWLVVPERPCHEGNLGEKYSARGVFVVNSSSRVCGLHFVETDYHNGGRQRERQTTRQNRMLKQGSVPTKFDCIPERLRRPSDDGKNKRKAPKERKEPPSKKRKEPPASSEVGESTPKLVCGHEGVRWIGSTELRADVDWY